MAWSFNNREAVFIQIANRLRCDIVCGKFLPNTQIPSVRQLAFEAAVNPNTMQKALSVLEDEGLLFSHGTVGRFVTSDTVTLTLAGERMRREAVKGWLHEAGMLGISPTEMIKYIEEEKTENEHTDTDLHKCV